MKAAVTRSGRPPGVSVLPLNRPSEHGERPGWDEAFPAVLGAAALGDGWVHWESGGAISTVSDFAWLSASSSLLHERGVQNSSLAGCIKHVVAGAGSNGHRGTEVARRVSGFLSAYSMCGRVLSVQGEHYKPVKKRCKVVELQQWRKQLVEGMQSEWTFLILTCCDPVGDRLSAGSKAASPSLRAVERLDHEASQIAGLSGVYRKKSSLMSSNPTATSDHTTLDPIGYLDRHLVAMMVIRCLYDF